MTDIHHLLPSFTWDSTKGSWVLDPVLNEGAQPSSFGVKSTLLLDEIAPEDLPTPLYTVGETIAYTVPDGIAFSSQSLARQGTIIALRLIGQPYVVETENVRGSSFQGTTASLWRQKCYSVDRVVYVVQNSDSRPWVDGCQILGRVQEEEGTDFQDWNCREQKQFEVAREETREDTNENGNSAKRHRGSTGHGTREALSVR